MTRVVALPLAFLATMMMALAADQSPENKSDEPDSFDIEPPLLKQNLSDDLLPGATQDADPSASLRTSVARLEKQLERVKRNAAGAERLCKMGVLSKVEVEQQFLKVVRCECDLANARLSRAKEEVTEQETKVKAGEGSPDELNAAKVAVAQLTEGAQVAAAKRMRAELETAEANVRRQEKLLKLGSAHKSDLDRAQQKLAELRAQKN